MSIAVERVVADVPLDARRRVEVLLPSYQQGKQQELLLFQSWPFLLLPLPLATVEVD